MRKCLINQLIQSVNRFIYDQSTELIMTNKKDFLIKNSLISRDNNLPNKVGLIKQDKEGQINRNLFHLKA